MSTSTKKPKAKSDSSKKSDSGATQVDEVAPATDEGGVDAETESSLINLAQESGSARKKMDELLKLAAEARREKGGDVEVAPFIKPTQRIKQHQKDREWERNGFISVSPGKPKLRHRILPRSVIGISFMLLASAVGIAFSGAGFYAYYDNRLAENEREVSRFVDGFDQQFSDATAAIDELRVGAVDDIRTELQPIEGIVSDADGVINLPATAGESVWGLETRDEQGKAVLGSAFAVLAHEEGTVLMTSYSLIAASTTEPSPSLTLTKRDQRINAQLWSWDAKSDLAIVMVEQDLPTLQLASAEEQVASVGTRVFSISGFGGQSATASPGVLLDQSASGLQHSAPVGTMFQGGPLVNGAGKVVGLSSLKFQPTGVDPGMVLTAPNAASFCDQVLKCIETTETIEIEVPVDSAEAPPAGNEPAEDNDEPENAGDGEENDNSETETETEADSDTDSPTGTQVEE